jgi:hypothetical protein
MESSITRAGFSQVVAAAAARLAGEVWSTVVEGADGVGADQWMREHGGAFLREVLGAAWTARAERLGVTGVCGCGGTYQFRQHRPAEIHTVLAGRDVAVRVVYGQCERCHGGVRPLVPDLGVDAEGFTPALRELGVLASVVEPYEAASSELLERFAGVRVSTEKLQALVQAVAPAAAALTAAQALPAQIDELKAALTTKKDQLMVTWKDMEAGLPKMVEAITSRMDILSKSKKLPKGLDQATFDQAKVNYDSVKTLWSEATAAGGAGDLMAAIAKGTEARTKATEILSALGMQAPAAPSPK